jgi:ubiquinone/menaquinone biosynthesis C-methylase UbiE
MDNEKINDQNDKVRRQWDGKAAFWDQLMGGEGNQFHRELVSPAIEELLALRPGEQVLDIACGTGVLARRLAELGGNVTGVDFSEGMLAQARGHEQVRGNQVVYKVVDATDEAALIALGERRFSAVVSSMAMMDMPELGPMYRAVTRLLKPGGRFVFATMHPAFNSNNPVFAVEQEDEDGELIVRNYIKISAYLDMPPVLAVGASSEPNPHTYYHRPLGELLGEAFEAGLVLDALLEPAFVHGYNPDRPL